MRFRFAECQSAAPYLFSLQLFRFRVKYVFHAPEGQPIIVGGRLPVRTLLIRCASLLQSVQRVDFLAKVTAGSVRLHLQQGR